MAEKVTSIACRAMARVAAGAAKRALGRRGNSWCSRGMPIYSFTALNHGAPRRTPWREFGLFENYIENFYLFNKANFVDAYTAVR